MNCYAQGRKIQSQPDKLISNKKTLLLNSNTRLKLTALRRFSKFCSGPPKFKVLGDAWAVAQWVQWVNASLDLAEKFFNGHYFPVELFS